MIKKSTFSFKKFILIVGIAIGLLNTEVQGQCTVCPSYDFSITPNSQWQLSSSSIETSGCKIFQVQVIEGYSYVFKTGCEDGADANFDTYIELSDSACSYLTYNDDDCNYLSRIEWVAPYTGLAYLKVRGYNANFGDFTLAYSACGANSLFTYVTNGFEAVFTNASSDTTANYAWYFGDGFNGSGLNPSHTYVCPNDIQVNLVVTDTSGCSTSFTQYLSFGNSLLADLSFTNVNNDYSFTDLSAGDPTSWEWDFGDGTSSTEQNPTHTYICAGYFDISLTVTNADGCTDTYYDYVYVENGSSNLNALFTYFSQGTSTGFLDVSTGNPTSWEWDFGDGGTSTVQNPAHSYECSGDYWVSLYVTNAAGCESSYFLNINASGIYTLEARFTLGVDGSIVTFNDSTIGNATNYEWDLDNGNYAYSPDTVFDYHCSGFYFVGLTVSNDYCTSSEYAGIELEGSLAADYSFTASNNTVAFTNLSVGDDLTYSWDFDDGNSSTGENPSNAYECPGDYDVELSVYDTFGCSAYYTESINVGNFTANFDYEVNNTSVNFTNTSFSTDSWEWNFGDGTTSTSQNPNHVYTCPDFYYVTLTVTNSNGCSSTYGTQVEITAGFQANFSYSANGTTVDFSNTSAGNTTNWDWSFGDGSSSTAENPSHTYECPGSYYVYLNLDNDGGCTAEIEQIITIEGLSPEFAYSVNNQTVTFDVLNSDGLDSYEWDFDDGTFSNLENPTHTFLSCGNYFVYLTVTNDGGCSDYSYQEILIQGQNPGFSLTSNSPVCQGSDLVLSSGDALGMEYDWEGPSFYYSSNPSPVISNATTELSGTYVFELTDVNGCPVVDSVEVEIIGEVAVNVTTTTTTLTSSSASSYQWIDCNTGNPVSGANGQVFSPTANGIYSVIITDANGCEGQSDCFPITAIGLDEVSTTAISVFPNPTSGLVTINGLGSDSKLKITDAVGRQLKVAVQSNTIDLSPLTNGIYFLSIESAKGNTSFKLVRQ
jgi:PKD repeat protein